MPRRQKTVCCSSGSALREQPCTHGAEDDGDEKPRSALRMREVPAACDAGQAEHKEDGGEDREDVLRGHASPHLREEFLLTPRGRARVEERRAWIEEAQIVRGEDALALVAVLEDVDAVRARHGAPMK